MTRTEAVESLARLMMAEEDLEVGGLCECGRDLVEGRCPPCEALTAEELDRVEVMGRPPRPA